MKTWFVTAGRLMRLPVVLSVAMVSMLPVMALAATGGDAGGDAGLAQRLEAAQERLLRARDASDIAACKAERTAMHSELHAQWTRETLNLWSGISYCEGQPGGDWLRAAPSAETITTSYADMLAHFDRMPAADRLQRDLWLQARVLYWSVLRGFGHAALADHQEDQALNVLLQAAAAQPEAAALVAPPEAPNPAAAPGAAGGETPPERAQAVASLTQYAQMLYGARARIAHMERLQARCAQALGAGHEATLLLMRTRVYALRQLQRPAQALALSDELAALVAQHRPADQRLAMLNRSERLGALAALGRYADAHAEGVALLAWLQGRQPRSQGNIMRAAYNLAGLAIETGDLDDAVHFAELSLREGLLASWAEGRQETHFSRMLLHQARALRGDAGARADLRAVLDEASTWDLPAVGMLATLHRLAAAAGDADNTDWALRKIRDVVAGAAAPLQPAHTLPLVLDAARAPPGSPTGLDAAARAVALGLASDDEQARVGAYFALAQQASALQPAGGLWLYKRGANALLQLRQGLAAQTSAEGAAAASALPRAWLAEHEAPLRQFIGLLIDAGRLKEAEQAIEVLRDEELQEFRRRSRGPAVQRSAAATLAPTPDEQARDQSLLALAPPLREAARLAQVRADQRNSEAGRTQTADAEAVQALEAAAPQIQSLALRVPAAAGSPGAAAPEQPAREGRQLAGRARLVYVLRANSTDVLLTLPSGTQRASLPHGSVEVNRAVQALRTELAQPGAGVPPAAQRLYDWLLRPFETALRALHHLQIAPDGALRYVPFSSLHDGRNYVVERHSVAVELAGSGAGAGPSTQAVRPARVAGFGRSLPDERHAALPGVQQELAALAALPGAQVTALQDAAFTAQALQAGLARKPDVVHLASHFVLVPAGEEASYLLLGDGQQLSLRALRELPWQGVKLALLSACDTGIGVASGAEWAGFADALHAAGVGQILASLWRVDDASTARWMRAFYTPAGRAGRARTPPVWSPQHLAATQRQWLRSHAGSPWAHPHHWAAFQWLGGRS